MEDQIHCLKSGPIWRITLNRPDKANALTSAMLATLADILDDAQTAPELRALHLTGTGSRVFCAGADLDEIGAGAGPAYFKIWESIADALAACPVLTIAALNGACMGGGLVLATACDIRVSVEHAKFAYPILKNGITPSAGQATRLVRLIGPARASLLVMGAARIAAEEALAWGLVDHLAEDAIETTGALSEIAAQADRAHLVRVKSLLSHGDFSQ